MARLSCRAAPAGSRVVPPRQCARNPAGTVTLIDLEATRIGVASFDVAAMAGGLLSEGSAAAARTWLTEAIPALGLAAENIAGFLALRAWHRHQAGALTAGAGEIAAALFIRSSTRRNI